MRSITISTICCLILAVNTTSFNLLATAPPAPPKNAVTLEELAERGVQGMLGHRLGKVVQVSGKVVANTSRTKADSAEPFFLVIEEVDGQMIATPKRFSSTAMPLREKLPGLKVGDRFRCVGYESGGFEGLPDGKFNLDETAAGVPFHFAVNYVVLEVKSPPR